MRIIFCKTFMKTPRKATTNTTTRNHLKIAAKICCQQERIFRMHLLPITTAIIQLHDYCAKQQQRSKQAIMLSKTTLSTSCLFQARRVYSTSIPFGTTDRRKLLKNVSKSDVTSGSDDSRVHYQKCASYVDVVAAASSVNGFSNASNVDNENASSATAATVVLMLDAAAAAQVLDETAELKSAPQAAASAEYISTLCNFTVQLNIELEPNEFVGLTGDATALGEWRLDNCVTLRQQPSSGNKSVWSANVLLQHVHPEKSSYRYFIYTLDNYGRKHIRRWESHPKPRSLNFAANRSEDNDSCTVLDRFGVMGVAEAENCEDFDFNSTKQLQVNRGWLTTESIVQFKFEREQMFRVLDADKFDAEHVHIKLEPSAQKTHYLGVRVDVARLNYGDSHLQRQNSTGAVYKRGDVVIFHLTIADVAFYDYEVLFYNPDGKLTGRALITSDQLSGSEGELELDVVEPVKENPAIVAQLTLPYLIVQPYEDAANVLDFRTTYAHYWPKSWPKLHVGHRGNGRSFIANPPAERENTLASFMRAYESHADMVELDVHLTADGVPIIYHDFGMRTAPLGKHVTSPSELDYVLIKDLSYEALKEQRVFAVINNAVVEYPAHNAEPRIEHRMFPRLIDVLDALPKTLGIDVEIKWPQRTVCGGIEAEQTIDKNFFVDRVLDTIIRHGCGRPLIFSCFDADVCTMLRFKQNIFPVMFLTMGETKKWSAFVDLRTRNFTQAINNAQAFELAGTAPHAEDFLGEHGSALMQKAAQVGQIAVVWGDDCNSKDRVEYFSAIGATAVCYDRSDLYMPEHKKRAFFNSTGMMAEFEA